ncbi:MAG: hypothetical protein A2293_09990 [Elusimicrobia bacterium RIFOXYB2_FULL_49_7]|nr:MAG: hypothetical protein A2293_09990 [Elusimicrobia bacterium RIFOXYB2_FULL_49_7]
MKLHSEKVSYPLKHPFKIARADAYQVAEVVRITLTHDNITGMGEIKPSTYYGNESVETVMQTLQQAGPLLGNDPFQLEEILTRLEATFPHAPAARAGIDIALHDWVGKQTGLPLYRYFGLNPEKTPKTSVTLGIDTIPVMLQKLHEFREYPILKVKVGVPGDMEIIRAIRDHSDAVIRVDANTGWSVEEAIERLKELEQFNIELVEQPIKPGHYEGLRKIRESTSIPIMADEDVKTSKELFLLAGCVDSINIKLMKCGGLREAGRMIHTAHSLGLKVMLGCMMESSLSLTAAAHLSPLVEYADLDTHLALKQDPFEGLKIIDGKIYLPDRPGIGIVWRSH